ncbi:hypothetical protein [Pseudonocardia xishanensis]|uniref:Uncharacterized protein n=1 Tax=Pseudonocardia xishanensis TaxID=630995 RepID=A0ABP8RYV7_9PSEU
MRTARVVVVLVASLVLGGCGAATTSAPSSGGGPSATLPALRTKLASLALDECLTQPGAQAYPNCSRFVREVQNVVPAARAESGAVASPGALVAAADAVDGAVGRLTQDTCVATGGAPVGGPQDCGPDFTSLQQSFRNLVAAVGS